MTDTDIRPVIKPEKVIRDGMVAVLYSPGYGAGWSTWTHDDELRKFVTFDRRLVAAAERNATGDEVEELLTDILGPDTYVTTGGWDKIKLAWIEQGDVFQIVEYDGSESIRFYDSNDYYTA